MLKVDFEKVEKNLGKNLSSKMKGLPQAPFSFPRKLYGGGRG
jgi:hypothetical protein